MFTGIVRGKARVMEIRRSPGLWSVRVRFPEAPGFSRGGSVALNGVCLTVTEFTADTACFDIMMETLRVTALDQLSEGAEVNFEPAARIGDQVGGHNMSGHIHGIAEVVLREEPENNCRLLLKADPELMKYVFPKGFIGLNGCSLTVGEVEQDCFSVYLIPETLNCTTFGTACAGDRINLEADSQTQAVVDTIYRMKLSGQL